MNKKIMGFLAVLAIAALAAWNVSLGSEKNGLSDVSMTNMEALATEFSFNGQDWNDTDTHWFGSDWKPTMHNCTGYGGGFSFAVCIAKVCLTYTQPDISSWEGKEITCTGGDGNCVNGTSCIPNAIPNS
jgi:hypothetical protein